MSTKTLRKRISLVAVSALGAGLLSIVSMPASNAATFGTISVGTVPAARAGSLITVPITINVTPAASGETITVAAKAVTAPTSGGLSNAPSVFASSVSTTNADAPGAVLYFGTAAGQIAASGTALGATYTAGTGLYSQVTTSTNMTDGQSSIGVFKTGTSTAGNIDAAAVTGSVPATAVELATSGTTATTATAYLTIKPDLAGTYTFIVSVSDGSVNRKSFAAGDTSTMFTVTTAGAPATAALTAIGGSSSTSHSGSYGALYRLTFKDAAGVATSLVGDEAFTITPTGANISKATVSSGAFASVAPSAATAISFGAADLVNGNGFMNVDATAAATNVVLTGAGAGTLPSTVTTTASFTSAAGAATPTIAITFAGAASTNNSVTTGWVGTTRVIPTTATSSTIELTRAAADNTAIYYGFVTIQDNNGLITGVANAGQFLTYDRAYSMAAAANFGTVSVTHAAPSTVGMTAYTATHSSSTGISGTVVSAASTLSSSSGSVTVLSPATSVRLATGGSVTISVRVRDQFRNPVANTGVAVTFAGRNAAKASATVVTGATGIAEYTFTDSATTGATDTITFSASGATTPVTVSYGTNTAGAVLVATPSTNTVTATTLAGADAYPKAWSEISASDGAEGGIVTVTALVTDADKNVMAGMPVAWTVTGTGCAITSTSATSYTGANGQATASLYAWLQGTCVVTATSGGQTDSANSYWRQSGEVRSISATVEGNAITATVKDRFGNPVRAIAVTATRTSGVGFFGSASSATANTDDNGQVIFAVSGGAAKATVGFADSTFQQTDSPKGLIDGVSTAAANTFTATTAGTVLTAEAGIGASFDAAGVNSVTVDVTAEDAAASAATAAADAAAEATDAANAATDAANAAAEAADAATAAAQDAADAVAALATSVEAMVNALKRQITSLTNLVIKIQKKVRA
jgi:trimeric autotransporter adhesin